MFKFKRKKQKPTELSYRQVIQIVKNLHEYEDDMYHMAVAEDKKIRATAHDNKRKGLNELLIRLEEENKKHLSVLEAAK